MEGRRGSIWQSLERNLPIEILRRFTLEPCEQVMLYGTMDPAARKISIGKFRSKLCQVMPPSTPNLSPQPPSAFQPLLF